MNEIEKLNKFIRTMDKHLGCIRQSAIDNFKNVLPENEKKEPEYEDYEIIESPHPDSVHGELGIYITKGGPWDNTKYSHFMTIEKLLCMPNFRGLYLKGFYDTRIDIQDVAELISKKQCVVARLTK